MKVVCDSCHAKYQIPDERVAGRKLRIRCRRCAASIIVRGDRVSAGAVSMPPAPAPDEWYVSHGEQEQGPMKLSELMAWLGTHGDHWGAYVWRDGMDDWLEARGVDELQRALGAAPPPSGDELPTQMSDQADIEPTRLRASDTHDPFDSPAALTGRGSYAPARPSHPPLASDEPIDAVVAAASASYGSMPPAYSSPPQGSRPPSATTASLGPAASGSVPPASSPRVDADAAMTGARNEESVLFSTASLRQVAASSSPSLRPAAMPSSPPSSPGMASGDASGLIDIRALSDLSRHAAAQRASAPPLPTDAHVIHTPLVGSIPALTQRPQKKGSGVVLPAAILGGSVVLAAAVFMGMVMRPVPAAPPAVAAAAAPPTPVAGPVEPAAAPGVQPPAAEPPADEAVAEDEAALAAADEVAADQVAADQAAAEAKPAPRAKRRAKARRKAAPRRAAAAKATAKAGGDDLDALLAPAPKVEQEKPEVSVDDILAGGEPPAPKPEPEKAPAPARDRSIDDLLSGAVDPAAKPKASTPATPTKAQVIKAMNGVKGAVTRCGAQHNATGVAKAQVTVSSSGKVTGVDVSGVDGPVTGCIESAVKRANFPEFSKPTFSVKYPFKL